MSIQNTPKPVNREWMRRMADAEEQCPSVSVGGLAVELGMHSQLKDPMPLATVNAAVAIAKLVELWRRQHRMTVEVFAQHANITEAEVVGIESGEIVPEPRVLYHVSQVIRVSYDKLMHVAGHIPARDERLSIGAVRFAARSESMEKLTAQEEEALHDFVNLLAE